MATRPGRAAISADEVRSLLASNRHRLDQTLSSRAIATVYTLDDGRAVCVYERGRGVLWQSGKELAEAFERRSVPRPASLPNVASFVSRVPQLISEFALLLSLPRERLDGTLQSLAVVDRALRRLGPKRVLAEDLFPGLVAYVGEVIRAHTDADWQLQGSGESAEPGLTDGKGRWRPLLGIFKEVLEHGRSASMYGFAQVEILAHRASSEK